LAEEGLCGKKVAGAEDGTISKRRGLILGTTCVRRGIICGLIIRLKELQIRERVICI
jgi:hypothetical protein